jgi:hypothetical protein
VRKVQAQPSRARSPRTSQQHRRTTGHIESKRLTLKGHRLVRALEEAEERLPEECPVPVRIPRLVRDEPEFDGPSGTGRKITGEELPSRPAAVKAHNGLAVHADQELHAIRPRRPLCAPRHTVPKAHVPEEDYRIPFAETGKRKRREPHHRGPRPRMEEDARHLEAGGLFPQAGTGGRCIRNRRAVKGSDEVTKD